MGIHAGMERAQRQALIAAAAGIAAAAVLETLSGTRRSRAEAVGRCLLAGGIAAVFTYMGRVPSWDVRVPNAPPLESMVWGGLTGLLTRWAS